MPGPAKIGPENAIAGALQGMNVGQLFMLQRQMQMQDAEKQANQAFQRMVQEEQFKATISADMENKQSMALGQQLLPGLDAYISELSVFDTPAAQKEVKRARAVREAVSAGGVKAGAVFDKMFPSTYNEDVDLTKKTDTLKSEAAFLAEVGTIDPSLGSSEKRAMVNRMFQKHSRLTPGGVSREGLMAGFRAVGIPDQVVEERQRRQLSARQQAQLRTQAERDWDQALNEYRQLVKLPPEKGGFPPASRVAPQARWEAMQPYIDRLNSLADEIEDMGGVTKPRYDRATIEADPLLGKAGLGKGIAGAAPASKPGKAVPKKQISQAQYEILVKTWGSKQKADAILAEKGYEVK